MSQNLKELAADGSPFSAHAGFLNGAENLMPFVSKKVKEITSHNQVRHILFTGHSAGGAVSSLLFAKHVFCAAVDCK
jgi:acyl-CoA reductase-like NAD-dependent aldehyde dehydrogenase